MKTVSAIILSLLSITAIATPPNFTASNYEMIFVDFIDAKYQITYDIPGRSATAISTITFDMPKDGLPIFDLVPGILEAKIDGEIVGTNTVKDPDNESTMRSINKEIKAGRHTLVIKNRFDNNTVFNYEGVASGFWMSDLEDRKYLEQYLPTNYEYDQYKAKFIVNVEGTTAEHEIFSNTDKVKTIGQNQFELDFPHYFTASSFFFHLAEKGRYDRVTFDFASKSGTFIPVVAYANGTTQLRNIQEKITKTLNELEGYFGAWSHPVLTVYMTGFGGGMEYAGATITSDYALEHELTHSFFARGILPINGNSGWMDEAIASWRDKKYFSRARIDFTTKMSGHSLYRRSTDRKAYEEGASFMGYLNHRLENQGGLKAYLAHIYQMWVHIPIYTEMFQRELENFSGMSFESEFQTHIFGTRGLEVQTKKSHKHTGENPYHQIYTTEELRSLL